MDKNELKEIRKQKLPTVTAFSPRDSLSNFLRPSGGKRQSRASSPLSLPKEFAQMEQQLKETHPKEEDSLFYYHSSEERIVLSHALFWTMTLPQFFKSRLRKEKLPTVTAFSPRDSLSNFLRPSGGKRQSRASSPLSLPKEFFLLLRQYQEEMLDAFLQDDDYFSDLLHSQDLRNERSKIESCNILYEMLPMILMSSYLREEKDARKLASISVVAAGYGGDMPEDLANTLLDDMDFIYNKVKCRKIEQMLPKLMKMVEGKEELFSARIPLSIGNGKFPAEMRRGVSW